MRRQRGGAPPGPFAAMRARYLIDTEEWTRRHRVRCAGSPTQPPRSSPTSSPTRSARCGAVMSRPRARARPGCRTSARRSRPRRKPADPAHAGMPGMKHAAARRGRARARSASCTTKSRAMIRHKEGASAEAIDLLRQPRRSRTRCRSSSARRSSTSPRTSCSARSCSRVDQPKEARAAFERALARTPERTQALAGLMKAAAQSGDRRKEAEIRARLQAIWHRADAGRRE